MKPLTKSFLIFFFLFSVICSLCSISYADIPRLITYQGKLTDPQGKPVEDKAHTITFRIYDAETAGALLWEETQSVTTQKGILSVFLGSVTVLNLPFDKPYFLEIKVKDEVMSPRQRIASAAYAIRAEKAADVDILPKGCIILWSGSIVNIPKGWALCDGTNGTPDLRDKFVKGVPNNSTNPGNTGGFVTHTHITPDHSHSQNMSPGHSGRGLGSITMQADNGSGSRLYNDTGGDQPFGGHYYVLTGTTSSGTGTTNSANSLPPYYEIAFIMKL